MMGLRYFFKKKKLSQTQNGEKFIDVRPNSDGKRAKVAILTDFENLSYSSKDDPEQKRLGRFLDFISFQEKKDIIVFWVFCPTHLASNVMSAIFHLYSAELVFIPHVRLCPRNLLTKLGKGLKDMDTVDRKIISQGKWLVDNVRDFSEIIVVSNDFDFSELKNYAKRRGVKFRLYPPSQAFSRDYLKTFNGDKEVILLEEAHTSHEAMEGKGGERK